MKTNLYIVRDKVANNCQASVFFNNDAMAIRWFTKDCCPQSKFADDLELIRLCEIDIEACQVVSVDKVILASGCKVGV